MSDVDQKVFTALLSGASNKLGDFLTNIITGGDAHEFSVISEQLRQIAQAIVLVQGTINSFMAQYQTTAEFDRCTGALSTLVESVDTAYDTLQQLQAGQVTRATDLQDNEAVKTYTLALDSIHRVITGTLENLAGDRLLHALAGMTCTAITGPGYDAAKPAPLLASYSGLEAYFRGMINVQTKAALLAINAFRARGDPTSADQTRTSLGANVVQQVQFFLAAVEELTVAYHHDLTLVDMLTGPPAENPLQLANAFVNHYPLSNTARLRLWSGQGPSFDLHGNQSLRTDFGFDPSLPGMAPETPAPVAFPVAGDLWSTTPSGQDSWSMLRFSLGEPPARTYRMRGQWAVNGVATPQRPERWKRSTFVDLAPGSCFDLVAISSLRLSDGSLHLSRNLGTNGDAFTVETWFLAEQQSQGWVVSGIRYDPNSPSTANATMWALLIRDDGLLELDWWTPPGSPEDRSVPLLVGTVPIRALVPTWYHVAMVSDRQTVQFYVNGAPSGGGAIEIRSSDWGPFPRLRGPTNAGSVRGCINELRVWGRALSQAEIAANMHSTPRSGDALNACFPFDRGTFEERTGRSAVRPDGNVRFEFAVTATLPWLEGPGH